MKSYVLVNRKPVAVESRFQWELENPDWKAEDNWRVAYTEIDKETYVSTVFLNLNANEYYENEPPVFFETGVCRQGKWTEERRYETWEEAEAGHWEIVSQLRCDIETEIPSLTWDGIFTSKRIPSPAIIFPDANGKEVGRIMVKDGQVVFEGNFDESAQIFVREFLNKYLNQ